MSGSTLGYITGAAAFVHTALRPLGIYDLCMPAGVNHAFDAATWVHVLRLLWKRDLRRALTLAAVFFRFPLVRGDHLTLAGHLWRFVCFRRIGLHLPPVQPLFGLFQQVSKFGMWQRHKIERGNHERYGPIYCIQPPYSQSLGQVTVFVAQPDLVEQVLCAKDTYPSRGDTGFSGKDAVGEGLLGLPTGPKWAHHRRIVSKFMTASFLEQFSTIVADETRITLQKWERSAAADSCLNAHYDFSMLTLDIILRCAFDVDKSERRQLIPEEENIEAKDLDFGLKEVILRTISPVYRILPNPRQAKLDEGRARSLASRDRIFATAMDRIQAENGDAPKTMISAMVDERTADGSRALSDTEILDELATVRGAGHETTSNTLCWTLLLLSRNLDAMRKLQAEVDAKVSGDVPNFAEGRELVYARQVIYEALRMFPTVPSFPRAVAQDTTLAGYDVPRGSRVFVCQSAMNMDGSVWDEPLEFRPERFKELPSLMTSRPVGVPGGKPFGFVPFGAGPRTCIGQQFAMMEAVHILCALIKRFEVELKNPEVAVAETADITLGPKDGLWLRVRERHSQPAQATRPAVTQ